MDVRTVAIDDVRLATKAAEAVLDHARWAIMDKMRRTRLVASLCPSCFYLPPAVAGMAISEQPCGLCGQNETYPTTNVDLLCLACAKRKQLCKHCGADVELRERNKL